MTTKKLIRLLEVTSTEAIATALQEDDLETLSTLNLINISPITHEKNADRLLLLKHSVAPEGLGNPFLNHSPRQDNFMWANDLVRKAKFFQVRKTLTEIL